jgi:hypothetical protein
VPGRGYVDYHIFGPLAVPLSIAGNYHDAVAYAKTGAAPQDIAIDLGQRMASYLADATGLRTIGELYQVVHGGGGAEKVAASFAGNLAGGFVPMSGAVRSATLAADSGPARSPDLRDLPTGVKQTVEQNLPGLRADVPLKTDVLGQPMQNNQAGWGAFLPRTGAGKPDPVLAALSQAGVNAPVSTTNAFNKSETAMVTLTPAEQITVKARTGALIKQSVSALLSSSDWNKYNDVGRAAVLQRLVSQAKKQAETEAVANAVASDPTRLQRASKIVLPVPVKPRVPLSVP